MNFSFKKQITELQEEDAIDEIAGEGKCDLMAHLMIAKECLTLTSINLELIAMMERYNLPTARANLSFMVVDIAEAMRTIKGE